MNARPFIIAGVIAAALAAAALWWLLQGAVCPEGFVPVETARGTVCVSGVLPQVRP